MKFLAPSPAELTRGRAATPIAFIRAIVTGYRRRGMDPASARIAWITAKSSTLVVRHIDDEQSLLQISCDRDIDES